MPDFKEMCLKMFQASEQAISILIAVQRECEELYVCSPEPKLTVVPLPTENEKRMDKE